MFCNKIQSIKRTNKNHRSQSFEVEDEGEKEFTAEN